MKNLFGLVAFLILFAASAAAQGGAYSGEVRSTAGAIVPGASIYVCASTAPLTSPPCTPQVNIYSDAGLTVLISQPLHADGNGNYTFFAAPGNYVQSQLGTGITPRSFAFGVDANAAIKPAASDGVQYVTACGSDSNDGLSWGCGSAKGNADIAVAINAAYAALPVTGGTIYLGAAASGCYSTSSTISFTTNNKVASIRALGSGPVCITYTGTGHSIDVAWGGQHFPDAFLYRIRLTGPGSGTSSTGLNIGVSGTYTDQLTLQQSYVGAFGTGVNTTSAGGAASFDISLNNSSIFQNGTGINVGINTVSFYLVNSLVAQNATCGIMAAAGPADVSIFGGDIEQNGSSPTTGSLCLTGNNIYLHTFGTHFENTTPSSAGPFFYLSGTGLGVNIFGGDMQLDAQASTTVPELINFTGGDTLNVDGVGVGIGTGVTLTQAILSSIGNCTIYTRFRFGQQPSSTIGGSGGGPCANISNEDSLGGAAGGLESFTLKNFSVTLLGNQNPVLKTPALSLASSGGGTILHQAPNTAGNFTITDPAATGNAVVDSAPQTETNKTLISPTIATILNTGTLTLPTSTDTLVGRATTDTFTNKTFSDTITSTLATGTPPLTVTSTTPVAHLTAVPTTYNAAGTQQTNLHVVEDSGTLTSASPSTVTVTLTGSAAFTSSSSYNCSVTNKTTQANPLKISYTDGSHFVVTGPNTVTDSFSFVCVGN